MKRGVKAQSGIWQYLIQTGILEHGTPDEIEAARKAYWREYKRNWKHSDHKSYTVSLTSTEVAELARAAKTHHITPTTFIRKALFAYLHSTFITPDPKKIQNIRLLLSKTYLLLQNMQEEDMISETLAVQFEHLEQQVLDVLTSPHSLEKLINEAVQQYPGLRSKLITLLQSLEL